MYYRDELFESTCLRDSSQVMYVGCTRKKKAVSQQHVFRIQLSGRLHKNTLSYIYFFHFDKVAFKNSLIL